MIDRTDFQAFMLPHVKGDWLDACSPYVDVRLRDAARERGLRRTTCDLEPREQEVRKLDLRVYEPMMAFAYDVVTSFDTLEHIDDYKAAIANLARYAKSGGALVVGIPSLWNKRRLPHTKIDPATHPHKHCWYFNPRLLQQELENVNLRVVSRWMPDALALHQVCCVWFMEKLR